MIYDAFNAIALNVDILRKSEKGCIDFSFGLNTVTECKYLQLIFNDGLNSTQNGRNRLKPGNENQDE